MYVQRRVINAVDRSLTTKVERYSGIENPQEPPTSHTLQRETLCHCQDSRLLMNGRDRIRRPGFGVGEVLL
jgi:hypothetical protein